MLPNPAAPMGEAIISRTGSVLDSLDRMS